MKYQLNQLPVKTTNGFKINNVEVELESPSFQSSHFFEINGDVSSLIIQNDEVREKYNSKIGLELDGYQKTQIIVPKDVSIKNSVFLQFDFQKNDVLMSHLEFLYEENSSCNFIIILSSKDEDIHFSHVKEMVSSKKGSCGNITFINLLNKSSYSFYALENDVLEDATIKHTIIDLGGKTRVYNAYINLLEYKANNTFNTIYIGKEDSLLDFNYYLVNTGCETNNQMRVEGAIGDTVHKNFRGTIDFVKGCSDSIGEEIENCVLLSDECVSRSLPQMLCGEENVVGAHGVSSGKVSEEKLFYLMSRGYNRKEAEKLIILGNFMSILEVIPDEDIRSSILEQIEKEI